MVPLVSVKPLLAVLVSILGAILILVSDRKPNLREFWSIAAGLAKFFIVLSMLPVILAGNTIEYTVSTILPGIALKFRVDALGIIFATTASFLWILTSLYSIGYVRSLKEHAQTRYFACFAISLSAAMGVAFAANLFTLFLFYEILTLITYPLVTHKETEESLTAGVKYLVYLLGSSKSFQLLAMILTYNLAGTLEFSKGGIFPEGASSPLLIAIYILFIAGYTKSAVMPLHSWLPAAMVAPTPVSALLHAVAVVKAGVFSVLRLIFDVFGLDMMHHLNLGLPTALFASFTILVASIIALTQDNLKLRLAYSTVSQLSYVILGAALLTPSGMVGGILQIVNHAFAKITLFFCAGAILIASHKTNISEMGGIGRKMPLTMLAFSIGALSMIGIPPAAGFISKWYLAVGSVEAGGLAFLSVILASTILNAAYFLPILYKAFFDDLPSGSEIQGVREAPFFVVMPLTLTAIGTLLLGAFPDYFLQIAMEVIHEFP